MLKVVTSSNIESFESLAAKFPTLWYSSDMKKQWLSNVFFHIYRIPKGAELRSKRLKRFDIREGRTLWNLQSNKHDEDQEPAEVELVALILGFMTVQF